MLGECFGLLRHVHVVACGIIFDRIVYVPAVAPRALVDVTGAGNAYCGGFTVSLARGYDAHESALRAAVSASFALEQFGVPHFGPGHEEEVEKRMKGIVGSG